jgi:polyisoprenoid-binding protein YceI
MKKTKLIIPGVIALLIAGGIYSFKVVANNWLVNATDAKVHFAMPNGKHTGTFSGLVSTFVFDPMDPSTSVLKATIDVNTVITDGGPKLDEHLKTADFFDAANHPTIEFIGESVAKTDSGFVAIGKLHMRDSIHTISVPFKFIQDGKKATFIGRMELYAGDYGIMKKSEKKNDLVVIDIEVPVTQE